MPTGIYTRTEKHKEIYRNRPKRYDEDAPCWRGGKKHNQDGYKLISIKGKWILEHRLIMETYLGRKLDKKEVVDHINGIKDDNRIENLKLFSSHGEHIRVEYT